MSKGQGLFGAAGEAAQVAEQDGELALLAGRGWRRCEQLRRHGPCAGKDGKHRNVLRRPELAGESDVGPGPEAGQGDAFLPAGRRQVVEPALDAHAAGRAAPPSPAHRGMRHIGHAARLEHGRALRHRDDLAGRVGDADLGVPAAPATQQPGDEDTDESAAEHEIEGLGHGLCVGPDGRHRGGHGGRRQRRKLLAGLGEAQQCQNGNEQCGCEQGGGGAREPALGPQPEPETQTGVQPGDHEQDALLHAFRRGFDPERPDLHGEGRTVAGKDRLDAGDGEMGGEHERDGEAERQLRPLAIVHPQGTPQIQRAERQAEMNQQRAEQQHCPRGGPPRRHGEGQRRVHGLGRDQPERDGAEVQQQEQAHDQARDQALIADAERRPDLRHDAWPRLARRRFSPRGGYVWQACAGARRSA